mgnify:CR=1 FL=1
MNDIKKIFKAIKLNKYRPSSSSYFDPVRKYFVPKTPEEEVRQKTIEFLETQLGVSLNRMRVEEAMAHTKEGHEAELISLFIVMTKKITL